MEGSRTRPSTEVKSLISRVKAGQGDRRTIPDSVELGGCENTLFAEICQLPSLGKDSWRQVTGELLAVGRLNTQEVIDLAIDQKRPLQLRYFRAYIPLWGFERSPTVEQKNNEPYSPRSRPYRPGTEEVCLEKRRSRFPWL